MALCTPRTVTRPLTVAALLASIALTVSACSTTGSAAGSFDSTDTFTAVYLGSYSTPPDPDTNYDGPGLNIIENTYEGLVAYRDGADTAEIVPELATKWSVSDDGLTYDFTLRPDVTFHDGTPFTAEAVVDSFERRTAVDGGPAYMVADVASVEPDGDHRVAVHLKAKNTAFLDYLASPFGVKMISPTVLDEHGGKDHAQEYLTTHDAGTGPYELSEVDTGSSYGMRAYDDYWGDAPAIPDVTYRIAENASSVQLELERGEVDAVLNVTSKTAYQRMSETEGLAASTFPNFTTQTLFVNPASKAFPTVDDRHRLFSAIDTESVIDASMGDLEEPTSELFPAGMTDASISEQGVTHDLSALAAMADSGTTEGRTIRVGYAGSSGDGKAFADELVAEFGDVGLTAESVSYASGSAYTMTDDLEAAPDLFVMSVFPDAGHVDAWARILYTPKGGLDLFGAEVPGLTDALDDAVASGDDDAYAAIAAAVNDSGYWLSTGSLNSTTVVRDDVRGVDDAQNVLEYNVLHFAALDRD
ncbi:MULTISPECIES: ABC transporter substrate-binding protein [Curtobacterium]|nr:ABC transporter substrate-binding protein [Curtobacterium flaccumfaciens]MCS6561252.1 ABC transporter substrate-binding protein [Curtobacterium flaccumfaciens pv. poinsettiae]